MPIVLKRTTMITDDNAGTASASPDPVPANAGLKQANGRWQKGQSGNPKGMKPGTRHKVTVLAEKLLDNQAEEIVQKCIEMAIKGDTHALKLAMERILSAKRTRRVILPDLPEIVDAATLSEAHNVVLSALRTGDIDAEAAESVARILDARARSLNLEIIEARLSKLEGNPT